MIRKRNIEVGGEGEKEKEKQGEKGRDREKVGRQEKKGGQNF